MASILKTNLAVKRENQLNMHCLIYVETVQSIESEEKTSCVFLDFAKAFDTVNHEILLGKLGHYVIRALILIWFKSYLSNRKQAVENGQCISNFKTITCAVPQRSVLDPLFFVIYVNDIHVSSPQVKFHLSSFQQATFVTRKRAKHCCKLLCDPGFCNVELDNISSQP